MENRNQSIDLIKIIAMIGVMALHTCINRTNELPGFFLSRTFGLSIPLFFMVSGFLMQGRTLNWEYSAKKILGILRFTFIICISFWLIHSIRHGFDFMGFVKLWVGSFVQRGMFGLFWYFGAMILLYMILPYFNKIENRNPYFLPGIILLLLGISFCTFMADYTCDFESTYILQTFRIWYWLLFFSLGQMFRKLNLGGHMLPLNFIVILVTLLAMLIFVWFSRQYLSGIEYFFGSTLMILYAFVVFGYIIQKVKSESMLIRKLSPCFLPSYVIHSFVITYVLKLNITSGLGVFAVWGDFLLVTCITLSVSLLIMKLPYMDKVFKV